MLTAQKPKVKKADPTTRTKWSDANMPIFLGGSAPNRTITFQNISMSQLAEKLPFLAGAFIHGPVRDGTGLDGGYDFSLSFSPIALDQLAKLQQRPPGAADAPSDPIGGTTVFDAVDNQLGLKLVEEKRPVSFLVIEHAEQKPIEN